MNKAQQRTGPRPISEPLYKSSSHPPRKTLTPEAGGAVLRSTHVRPCRSPQISPLRRAFRSREDGVSYPPFQTSISSSMLFVSLPCMQSDCYCEMILYVTIVWDQFVQWNLVTCWKVQIFGIICAALSVLFALLQSCWC